MLASCRHDDIFFDMNNNPPVLLDKLWFIALIACPIVLWILPADFFDNSNLILCPSRLIFNIECWGCGMTRAIMHMHHFDFEGALFYNMGSVFVYPALFVVWLIWTIKCAKRLDLLKKDFHILGFIK